MSDWNLADMSPEEQDECRFMAAEVATGRTWYIIGRSPGQYGQWIVVTRSGRIETRLPEHIVPLPGLPRMVWPGEQATEDDMSIIPPRIDTSTGHDDDVDMTPEDAPLDQIGRMSMEAHQAKVMADSIEDYKADRFVDVDLGEDTPEPDPPRPEDAPDGYYLVRWWGEEHPVPAEKVQGQWWVIGKPTMLPAKDVLIVSRLVPEVEA